MWRDLGQHMDVIRPAFRLDDRYAFPFAQLSQYFPYISPFIFLQMICLRYFGAETIWYLLLYLLCDKLFTSSADRNPQCSFFVVARPLLFWHWRFFLALKCFLLTPSLNGGFVMPIRRQCKHITAICSDGADRSTIVTDTFESSLPHINYGIWN